MNKFLNCPKYRGKNKEKNAKLFKEHFFGE